MRETDIEGYLREQVELNGGMCEKHVSPGRRGVPDRICSWRFGFKDWVETKRPTKGAEPHQKRDHKRRNELGSSVFIINSKDLVHDYIAFCIARDSRAIKRFVGIIA